MSYVCEHSPLLIGGRGGRKLSRMGRYSLYLRNLLELIIMGKPERTCPVTQPATV